MAPDAITAASGGSLLFDQYRPFAILELKNRKTEEQEQEKNRKRTRTSTRTKNKEQAGRRGGFFFFQALQKVTSKVPSRYLVGAAFKVP
jgi:hypothetical protein